MGPIMFRIIDMGVAVLADCGRNEEEGGVENPFNDLENLFGSSEYFLSCLMFLGRCTCVPIFSIIYTRDGVISRMDGFKG